MVTMSYELLVTKHLKLSLKLLDSDSVFSEALTKTFQKCFSKSKFDLSKYVFFRLPLFSFKRHFKIFI